MRKNNTKVEKKNLNNTTPKVSKSRNKVELK